MESLSYPNIRWMGGEGFCRRPTQAEVLISEASVELCSCWHLRIFAAIPSRIKGVNVSSKFSGRHGRKIDEKGFILMIKISFSISTQQDKLSF